MLKHVLVVVLAVMTATAHAACVKSAAGGAWVDCDTGKPAPAPTPKKPINVETANQCLQGVRAAYEAYTMAVYDAKNPPIQELSKALDFRFSQQPFPASEEHAMKSLGYNNRGQTTVLLIDFDSLQSRAEHDAAPRPPGFAEHPLAHHSAR
jgi:hypothetical protein